MKRLGVTDKARGKKCKVRFSLINKNKVFQKSNTKVGVKKLLRAGMMPARTWGMHAMVTAPTSDHSVSNVLLFCWICESPTASCLRTSWVLNCYGRDGYLLLRRVLQRILRDIRGIKVPGTVLRGPFWRPGTSWESPSHKCMLFCRIFLGHFCYV